MDAMQSGRFDARVQRQATGKLSELTQSINRALSSVDAAIAEVVGVATAQSQGDVRQQVSGSYQGQLARLADAMNVSSRTLLERVGSVLQSSHAVADMTHRLSDSAQSLSNRVQQQSLVLQTTSDVMQQLNRSVNDNTQYANQASGVAVQVQEQTHNGSLVMQRTIAAMASIQGSSHRIADIVALIDDIAFQTNLLALNAAVEAARAGEHGRGFAVVASEVRALAGKSADAAKDIRALITESVQRVDEGTRLADESGEMLTQMETSISTMVSLMQNITQTSGVQMQNVQQVHAHIQGLNQVTHENANMATETTAATQALQEEAVELERNMAFFKLS